MGVTLNLRLIDHKAIVIQGGRVLNRAIRKNDLELLRAYLASLPIEVNPAVVRFHKARLAKLREVKAPEVIIESEEGFLKRASGQAYRPRAFRNASFDELRHVLGTWCWQSHNYYIPSDHEVRWFLEPRPGPKQSPLMPFWSNDRGKPTQSTFSKAVDGVGESPRDTQGTPLIRTCGSTEPGCHGYNPPRVARTILRALNAVDLATWEKHVRLRTRLYRRADIYANMNDAEIESRAREDLERAREGFPLLLTAYRKAVERGFGVSCEYSL